MRGSTLLALALLTWVQITHGQVAQTASWTTVSPGFDSQVLLNHKNGMWAAGSGGSIAVSVDAGQHWQKKHEESRDGLLLAVGFVGDKFGYAAGTGTHLLVTEDEGETWKASFEVPEAVFQAAFGDAQHGVIRTRSSLLSTANGGKTWSPVKPSNDPGWQAKYPYTDGMAALDPMHLIIRVSEGQYGGGEFLWTSDGGMTWTANSPPNGAGGGRVFVAEGKYWSMGGEVVGKDKPGGGLNVPMAIRSQDGGQWDHLPAFHEACHWTGCGGCTSQAVSRAEVRLYPSQEFSKALRLARRGLRSNLSTAFRNTCYRPSGRAPTTLCACLPEATFNAPH